MNQSMITIDTLARSPAAQKAPAGDDGDPGASFGGTLDEQMNGGGARTETEPTHSAAASPKEPAPSDTAPANTPDRPATGEAGGEDAVPAAQSPGTRPRPIAPEMEVLAERVAAPLPLLVAATQVLPSTAALPATSMPELMGVAATQVLPSTAAPPATSLPGPSDGQAHVALPGMGLPEVDAVQGTPRPPAKAAPLPGGPVLSARPTTTDTATPAVADPIARQPAAVPTPPVASAPRPPVPPARLATARVATPAASTPIARQLAAMPGQPAQEETRADTAPARPTAGDGMRTAARSVAAPSVQGIAVSTDVAPSLMESTLAQPSQDPSTLAGTRVSETASGFAQTLAVASPGRGELATSHAMARALPSLDTPMGSRQWESGLGSRIAFGVAAGVTTATLALNPQELGPVNIQLNVADDEATVQFSSQHAVVRDAIESAMPRLREALAEEGIRLVDVAIDTGAGASRDEARSDGAGDGNDADSAESEPTPEMEMARPGSMSSALVDTFA